MMNWAAQYNDLFTLLDMQGPVRKRFRVVSLLPKAARKANANSTALNGCRANSEMACSISTAFMDQFACMTSFGSHPPEVRKSTQHHKAPRIQIVSDDL